MLVVCICISLTLALAGIVMICMDQDEPPIQPTRAPHPQQPAPAAPAAAQRGGRRAAPSSPRPAAPAGQMRTQTRTAVRRTTGQIVTLKNGAKITCGPDGLWPDKFPCCPLCRCRNRVYSPQVVFWQTAQNGYLCVNGHRFKRNGWPI